MRDPAPRAPFDQGLFLTHFNRGKALYEERKFPEAERELEEAYLLRPRDQNVLNLLGLVYFKQDKLEKAEEVYRKLAAESPEAATLYYNLGLIHFKLNRLEDAELAFLKALELAKDNHKINFYLGSVYERLQRFPDAIYQYRQAGAHLMVRRVEDKMAAAPTAAGSATTGVPAPKRAKKGDDTAEFKVDEIKQKLRQKSEETLSPAKPVQPLGSTVLADKAPGRLDSETARFRLTESTLPPRRGSEVISFPQMSATDQTVPPREGAPRPADTFRFLENNLMEIQFSGKVFIKQGTVYSYGGNLTFWVKDKRPGGAPALVIVTGSGKVILTDRDREITFMHVENEAVFIEPGHLLACEETLTPRYVPMGGPGSGLEFLALDGRGMVALSASSKPLALPVTPELPVSVPASSIISWTGNVTPTVVEDHQLREVMLARGDKAGILLRLEGKGRLLVEQALA
ncbi:MAG TPA: tetratricopeptide repeat protein [Vicinamibacteria bacterium]|nr:tetratricopeptide repeat protein [Vicinamibacteria bacterium]